MQISKCLIISRDLSFVTECEMMLQKAPFLSNVASVINFEEAILKVSDFAPGLILVDISTLSLSQAQSLFDIVNPYIPIVLISDDPFHAVESYRLGIAADFILKPVKLDRLMVAINRALKQSLSYSGMSGVNFSFLKIGRSYKKFLHDEIIFIEAYGAYVKLYTEKGKFIVNDSISKVEEKLANFSFIRVHKSYIINTQKIISFNTSSFELILGKVPIGPNFKQRLEGLFMMLSKTHFAQN